ncbi:DUF5615 family PIN-like protein [Scytonema millei]|uniref:DUF5615 family PIN-like protein n=1 Tax=Scytonema millei VB511283 TaxID=1245923 RepID=A0A9X5I6P6_9CYAN|nr:DUF5615 family PIN-like protein [Scytonema millei]NHC36929.1 DUF5615 family PIN-like protein [Scytonema millei VB511283]
MTKIRFQADADLKQAIVASTIRRETNIDFQSAYVAGLEGKTDQEVLAIAARDEGLLVTHDRKTMSIEFGKFITTQTSTGVIIISQNLSISDAIESLILIWEASEAEEWINQIMSIPF